tara:strand:- start:22 stop:378 length:357 start_codon:yes stop_codon:yes gene_type:complete
MDITMPIDATRFNNLKMTSLQKWQIWLNISSDGKTISTVGSELNIATMKWNWFTIKQVLAKFTVNIRRRFASNQATCKSFPHASHINKNSYNPDWITASCLLSHDLSQSESIINAVTH